MPRLYSVEDLASSFDSELIWRRKELSDLKTSVRTADAAAQGVLLKSLTAITYSHWEGYVRECATLYFEYLCARRLQFASLRRQFYANTFLARLDALSKARVGLEEKLELISEIIDGQTGRLAYINRGLIDTKSNLNTDVVKEICRICDVEHEHFENKRTFIDVLLLKRRNAIAHGQDETVGINEIDDLVAEALALMEHFRTLLENKIVLKEYQAPVAIAAPPAQAGVIGTP